jgi:hypothetical protein
MILGSHQPLFLCRSFFGFYSVRLGTSRTDLTAPATHQALDLQKNEISSSATPVPHSGTQKIFGSRPCPNRVLSGLMVISQPLVAHGVGSQDVDDL